MMEADWQDGVDHKGLWTYTQTGPSRLFDRHSKRDDALWFRIVEARKPLIVAALAWRDAAIADGWTCEPTYPQHETVNEAFKLYRAVTEDTGFTAHGLARPATDKTTGTGSVSVWGPDRLAIPSGRVYSMAALQAGLTTCSMCHATGVPTQRAGFANRVCATCLPAARASLERPGWTS